mmetsp:Transcript_31561/g.101296  ORF Transcript_31561/g.101296 Transcript_31561/m.101296 type:complete len:222 (+) Transcript_31561:848-1513(+)
MLEFGRAFWACSKRRRAVPSIPPAPETRVFASTKAAAACHSKESLRSSAAASSSALRLHRSPWNWNTWRAPSHSVSASSARYAQCVAAGESPRATIASIPKARPSPGFVKAALRYHRSAFLGEELSSEFKSELFPSVDRYRSRSPQVIINWCFDARPGNCATKGSKYARDASASSPTSLAVLRDDDDAAPRDSAGSSTCCCCSCFSFAAFFASDTYGSSLV